MTAAFGATSQASTPGLFGKPLNNFGAPTTTSGFAFNSSTSNNIFGTNTQAKPFGSKGQNNLFDFVFILNAVNFSLFVAPATSTLFQAANPTQPTTSPFAPLNTTQNNVFGNVLGATPSNQVGLIFLLP